MKILIDECLPKRLKSFLPEFEVFTSAEMGWASFQNGELLQTAVDNQFDILLTADRNLEHQQNIPEFNISIVVFNIPQNKLEYILPLLDKVKQLIGNSEKGKVYSIQN